jgi:MFS transporter, DHA1 family, inner membrane transport protein
VIYLTFWAISSSMYWTTYHAYVALLGDNEHRGAQVSVMESLGIGMGIVAPLAMGLMLTSFTPLVAFSAIALVMAGAAVPIWLGPDFDVSPNAVVPQETRSEARLLMFTDGLRSGSFHFTWLIALFITLGGSYVAYGGAMAFAAVVGAIGGLVLGKVIDLGHGKRAAQLGFAALSIAVVARAAGYPIPWTAFLANGVAALAWPLYATVFNSRMYQLARQSACPLRYHIVAEGGWDLGTGLSCAISALLIYAGFSYFWPLMVALVGCAMGYVLLTRTLERAPLPTS